MDAKASRWQFGKKWQIYLVLKYLSANSLITKGKMRVYSRVTWRMPSTSWPRNQGHHHQQWNKATSHPFQYKVLKRTQHHFCGIQAKNAWSKSHCEKILYPNWEVIHLITDLYSKNVKALKDKSWRKISN